MGAQPDASLTTLTQCQAACVANLYCVAVDWITSLRPGDSPCWIHYNANNLARRYSTPSVTQYELINRCTTQVTTVDPGRLVFKATSAIVGEAFIFYL